MLHGLGSGPLELQRLAKEAHQEGFSVLIPSIDGYCYGTEPQAWPCWLEQVQQRYWDCKKTYETVSVVGVSMGATLALLLGEHESPAAMVLLSSALGYDGWAIPWYHFALGLANWIPWANRYQYRERDPFGIKNEETRTVVRRMMSTHHISESGAETLPFAHISQGHKLIRHVMAHAEKIDAPVLFMHAVDDESVHIRNPERLFAEIRSKTKEFIYLGDSYHMITIDNERDIVHKESLRFLKKMVNRTLDQVVFPLPSLQSYELRKQLKHLL